MTVLRPFLPVGKDRVSLRDLLEFRFRVQSLVAAWMPGRDGIPNQSRRGTALLQVCHQLSVGAASWPRWRPKPIAPGDGVYALWVLGWSYRDTSSRPDYYQRPWRSSR